MTITAASQRSRRPHPLVVLVRWLVLALLIVAVVTAAAIIMISVFAGFIFSHDATIKPIGFGLAFGVLLDAFVVRMLLIPAAMHLLGEAAWWLPKWLDRVLPRIELE